MKNVALILGSNLDDRLELLGLAIKKINSKVGEIKNTSSIYETAPWGFNSDNSFLNQVLICKTELSAHQILIQCLAIENELGRVRKGKGYIDRTIDIDILLLDNEIHNTSELTIPHPRMHERMFCMAPLNEVAPNWIVPKIAKTVKDVLRNCTDKTEISTLSNSYDKV